ncbi:hypothetical protein R1CP_07765 [Rhodococcus opacus]|uniref:Polyketide cyclase n=1 Tax=Rhodococcus opacus TaxID=37919 RepID=A0A1B1K0X2_RHOOP|nr:hypothetical protein R1CP_07765 [Rhodococcus opacus]
MADQRNEVRYNPAMTDSIKITDGPIGVGTRFHTTILRRGKPLAVIIEYTGSDRPHLLASRSVLTGAVVTGRVRCEPIAGGTRLQWEWEITVPGTARLAGPVIGFIGRRQERTIWTGLEHVLEAETDTV